MKKINKINAKAIGLCVPLLVALISSPGTTIFPDLLYDWSFALSITSAFTFLSILSPFSIPSTASVK